MKKLTALVLTLTMILSMLVIPMGASAAELTEEERQANDALASRTNFPIAASTGANAKLFIDHATYQTYKTAQNADEEWVKGLDYAGVANVDTSSSPNTARPTGTDADVITNGQNSAFVYKIDQPLATSQYSGFVSLVTKNGALTWTVNGTDFVINPYEKIIKVYTPTDTSNVTDLDLKARFETLNNPVLDIEDGCYESITVLAGANGAQRTLIPTVIYEDGTEEKLTGTITKTNTYVTGSTQNDGWLYLQALTPSAWTNTNSGGAIYFNPVTLTGFDTTKKIDKISFKSDAWGTAIYVISAFGEADSIAEILDSANIEDMDSVLSALNAVDTILAQNNITVNDLTDASIEKYNALKAAAEAIKDGYEALKLKRNFPIAASTGANAKLFIDHATYQTYKTAQNADEEWVKGLDYVGLANVNTSVSPHTAYPTGTDTDVITAHNNAFVYKVDQPLATGQYSGFVSLVTKNGALTWTVNGTDFVINPYEKIIKVYTPTDTSNVTDLDLKARFETLNNPVLDIKDGCYESITVLAGSNVSQRTLIPTVIYEDGTEEKLTGTITKPGSYVTGSTQNDGWLYLQALTNWSNTNSGGAIYFNPVTLTGFDTTKKIDKISFKSDAWGTAIYVISAFGETVSLLDILNSADIEDYDSVVNALDTVDAILEQNNITVNDLKDVASAKYNALKAAKDAMAVFAIDGIELENNIVTVNYTNGTAASVDALLIVAQYKNNETELVSVKKYPVSLTTDRETLTQEVETTAGNKVKIFVWRSLADLFPLTSNIYNN